MTVEVPLFVQVPGEVGRLLGPGVRNEAPVWWTEVRAAGAVTEAGRLAGSVAGRLVSVLGGATWPADAAHTGVVSFPSAIDSSPDEAPIGVDFLTDRAAVVIQDRPLVAATTWLTDLVQAVLASGREIQILTPPGTRLTLPTRTLMTGLPARWVVRDPARGYYDGLTGAVLHWHAGRFAPVPTADGRASMADAFETRAARRGEQQLHLTIRTTHPADDSLVLGGALEAAWRTLTGDAPAGWSTAEPVNLPWSPRQLTELARARAEKSAPTWLVAVGAPDRPAIGTCRVVRTPAGVEEQITVAFGYTAGQAPVRSLSELAQALAARHRLTSMLACLREARADLTTPPHRELPLVPRGASSRSDVSVTPGWSPTPRRPGSAWAPASAAPDAPRHTATYGRTRRGRWRRRAAPPSPCTGPVANGAVGILVVPMSMCSRFRTAGTACRRPRRTAVRAPRPQQALPGWAPP
ncbi:DUF6177 family protein [Streptomyces sp. SID6139]|uniref:DUF6177 family protein n=1 Tax=Streptomyces sp. SID6139 TaxID=2690320 RepID=UPI00136F9D80|nr:hypothetical protein [Streptomyces sp. SID6139]